MHSGDKTVRWDRWEAKHLEHKQLWLARAKNLDSWPRGLGTRREVKDTCMQGPGEKLERLEWTRRGCSQRVHSKVHREFFPFEHLIGTKGIADKF